MKIIHISAGIQETCGVSQFVVNVARAQQARGFSVCIITPMTCGFPVDDLNVVITDDVVDSLRNRVGSDFRDTIVHVHCLWNRYLHAAIAWCRGNRVRYVLSPHGSTKPWAMRYKWWKKIPAWWLYQRKDLLDADGFHATADDEAATFGSWARDKPLAIAPLGATIGTEFGFDAAWAYRDVVFVGRIHPVKNLGTLLRSWKFMLDNRSLETCKPRLVIAGANDIGHQEDLITEARSLHLKVSELFRDFEVGKKQIHGGGEVPVEEFRSALARCEADVVFAGPVYSRAKDWMFAHAWTSVLPSHTENFGGVVIESLAQGTPVIASRSTPWRDLLGRGGRGRCGWWIDVSVESLADTLSESLKMDMDERGVLAANAHGLIAAEYSWDVAATRTLDLYHKVIGNRSAGECQ